MCSRKSGLVKKTLFVVKWSKITIWGTSKIDSWWYPGLVKKICRYTFFDFWLWIVSLFAHVHFGKDFRNPYQNGMVKNWKNPKSKIEKVLFFFYWLGILSGIDFGGSLRECVFFATHYFLCLFFKKNPGAQNLISCKDMTRSSELSKCTCGFKKILQKKSLYIKS